MGRPLGKHPVAPLSYLCTACRLVVLCALALALIPTALAQDSQLITPNFNPPNQWHLIPTQSGMRSEGSSKGQNAQFMVDSNAWNTITISAGVWARNNNHEGQAALFQDGQLVLSFGWDQGGVPYQIPEGRNHVYNYTIGAPPNIPESYIVVHQVFVHGARSSTTQTGQLTPGATSPVSQISSTQTVISSTSTVISSLSITSTIQSTSLTTTIPTAASPTIPTGLLSPPAFTNLPTSISDASLVSNSSDTPGPNNAAIVGAVFGILVGLALCIFAALLYRRRRVRNRVAPSTAFMNYRSTTEQPPAYPFNRTSFFRRSKAGLAGFGGFGDRKAPSPHPFSTGVAGLGYGATAGAGERRLMALSEKSAEGRDSLMTSSRITPLYEDSHRFAIPY